MKPQLKPVPATNSWLIYQCIVDLRDANRVATRQVISQITGLRMTVVDDHVKRLRNSGRLSSPVNGVFETVEVGAVDRAVSLTILSSGRAKLEIGDCCMELSPRELAHVGTATMGASIRFLRG